MILFFAAITCVRQKQLTYILRQFNNLIYFRRKSVYEVIKQVFDIWNTRHHSYQEIDNVNQKHVRVVKIHIVEFLLISYWQRQYGKDKKSRTTQLLLCGER